MPVERKHMADMVGVRYLGGHDRGLSVADLAAVGVEAKQDLLWNDANDHMVPVDQLNADTVDYLATDPDFELV